LSCMARFYLHMKEGTHLIRDEEGCNVGDFDQAALSQSTAPGNYAPTASGPVWT